MQVRVRGRKLGSRDHHCLSGRDAEYGFRDRISRDLSIFPCFSNSLLFLLTLASRGARSASRNSKLSKPTQSLISKVTKKRVGFNLKIFVFALLKTVHCRAERNPGRIGRLFNCNDRCFFIWREAPKPKCLPGLVSPLKV